MKVREDLILREVAGENILIPVGEIALDIKGMFTLTESGTLLYRKLTEDCTKEDLVQALLDEYEVDQEKASEDVDAFLEQLEKAGVLQK